MTLLPTLPTCLLLFYPPFHSLPPFNSYIARGDEEVLITNDHDDDDDDDEVDDDDEIGAFEIELLAGIPESIT